MAKKKDNIEETHRCGECALGVPDYKFDNLSLKGEPTLVSCPRSGRFKRVVSELACADFVLRVAVVALLLAGCMPTKRVYRVYFADGEYEYYELDYRPKTTDKSIEYNGETILGVKNIELIK